MGADEGRGHTVEADDYTGTIKLYSEILSADPGSNRARANRGFAELQLNQPQAALADMSRAAEQGDAYAQDFLGRMYLAGTAVPQNRDKAIEWLRRRPIRLFAREGIVVVRS